MKTPIEHVIGQLEAWLEAIDRDRDGLAQLLDNPRTTTIERAFIGSRLVVLETDRTNTLRVLELQRSVRHTPALMFPERPRMARAQLRAARRRAS